MLRESIADVMHLINQKKDIPPLLLEQAFFDVLHEEDVTVRDVLLGSLLTGIMAREPSVDEIAGLLRAVLRMGEAAEKIKIGLSKDQVLIGATGSGKKGLKTMNISTPSALVAAAAGAFIAKTGSSSTSSITGSSDFVQLLGINTQVPQQTMIKILQTTGFGFFTVEHTLPKFDKVYGQRFHFPHALSFALAAIISPIECDKLLYGISNPKVELAAKVLREFNFQNAMVVCSTYDGLHYIDEIGVSGKSSLIEIAEGGIRKEQHFHPSQIGIPAYPYQAICQGKSVMQNVQYAVDVLAGCGEPAREDVVCLNAAAMLVLAERAGSIEEGYRVAKQVIQKRTALDTVEQLIRYTGGDMKRFNRLLSRTMVL